MTDDEWTEIKQVLEEVVTRPADEREAFLQEAIAEAALREEVASLARAYEEAGGLFENVASAVVDPELGEFQEKQSPEEQNAEGQRTKADPLELEGKQVGRYAVDEHLGGGGMGVVYRARDTRLGRDVALKFLPTHLAAHAEAKARFIREAKAASALDHPSIATIYEISNTETDVGRARAGQLFIAMAYYDGETLKAKIARDGPLPIDEAISYAAQIVEGLAEAHEAGIIHRDVKPANVMVTEEGVVKLVDFGLAKAADQSELTRTGQAPGTAAYMSPEQARGEAVDARTDLWSLGAVLYEMLTGERPFRGMRPEVVIYAVLHEEPQPLGEWRPEVSEKLANIVERCLQKDPSARYVHASDVWADLREIRHRYRPLQNRALEPVSAAGRRRTAVVLSALLIVIGSLLAYLYVWGDEAEHGSSQQAERGATSIAVLPFTHLAATDSADYFSLGMTDELLTRLSQIEGLSTIALTSVMQYREADKTIPEIGTELGVTHIVEGSVQQAGRQVRIQAQLVDARTGERLWAEGFTRPFRDVLQMQVALARQIAKELRTELLPGTQMAEAPEVDSVAYTLYLQGRHLRFRETDASMARAVRLLRRSVALDSTFAPAWATLSTCSLIGLDPGSRFPEGLSADSLAHAAARRAVALDSASAEAHVAMGVLRQILDRDFPAAGPWLKRATLLNLSLANAHREYGQYLSRMTQFEEAEPHLKKAVRLDPASALPWYALGWNDLWRGRYREAERHFKQTLTLQTENWLARTSLVDVYLGQGETKAALREARRLEVSPSSLGILGRVYVRTGQPDSARAVLRRMREEFGPSPLGEAAIYAALGRTDRAMDLLEKTGGNHYLKVAPMWEPLRGEPRYEQLLEEMGLDDASVRATMERLDVMDSPDESIRASQ